MSIWERFRDAMEGAAQQLPVRASTFAAETDTVFYFIFALSVFFFLLIVLPMLWFVIRYRKRDNSPTKPTPEHLTHNTWVEVTWTVIPLILFIVIFFWSYKGFLHASVAPGGAYQIDVVGQKWQWTFKYPFGLEVGRTVEGDLPVMRVPIDRPVRLLITSKGMDGSPNKGVLHSFFVPEFRVKMDAIPGRYTTMWFEANRLGTYPAFCAEYCGDEHSKMYATVEVMSGADFDAWAKGAQEEMAASAGAERTPAERGKLVFQKAACFACHTIDGTRTVGPSFKGLWGKREELEGGASVVVDEDYVRESMRSPGAKVVKGYPPAMQPVTEAQVSEDDIRDLIEFMKTLK